MVVRAIILPVLEVLIDADKPQLVITCSEGLWYSVAVDT